MKENKTQPSGASVAKFIRALPDRDVRGDCETLIGLMRAVTKSDPKLWGPTIVGFGSYHYRYDSGREGDSILAGFSPRKGALAIYGMSGLREQKSILASLGKCRLGKGCLYVRRLEDVDLKVLKSLLVASVKRTRARWQDSRRA